MTSLDRRREDKQSGQLCGLLECHFQLIGGEKMSVISVIKVCKFYWQVNSAVSINFYVCFFLQLISTTLDLFWVT